MWEELEAKFRALLWILDSEITEGGQQTDTEIHAALDAEAARAGVATGPEWCAGRQAVGDRLIAPMVAKNEAGREPMHLPFWGVDFRYCATFGQDALAVQGFDRRSL